ncbi:MAG: DnaA regulatory inactivator Hda [Burkholderiales bacterium]
MKQLVLALVPTPEASFENFRAGRNAELRDALRAAASGASSEHCIYLWGEPGSGRTHLLKAMQAALAARGVPACYVAGSEPWPDIPSDVAALLVDDVELLDAATQTAFFVRYNHLREHHGLVVAAGPLPPARLSLRPDLVTRLSWGLTYQVYALSDAEKGLALKDHALARAFELPDEVIEYLLRHLRRDLPSLIGVLEALDQHSLETHRAITVPLLRELLQAVDVPNRAT